MRNSGKRKALQKNSLKDVCVRSIDTDGWLGEFSGHHKASLIWKEGEVYLLPYSEEDVGYYKAPGRRFNCSHDWCVCVCVYTVYTLFMWCTHCVI